MENKNFKNQKNIVPTLYGLILGILITFGSMKILPIAIKYLQGNEKSQSSNIENEKELKKQELTEFYKKISTAQDSQDWKSMYQYVPQSLRDNITEEQFIYNYKNLIQPKEIFSSKTIVHKIEVNGNNGVVYRTIKTCFSEACVGDDKSEDNGKKEYVYVEGKWQMPDPDPSERSLKAVNFVYADTSQKEQKEFVKNYSFGSNNLLYALRNKALELDNNLEDLIRIEILIEKTKAEQNRPIVNYEAPSIIQPQAPVIHQQNYPKNCTSNQVGNSTYTNCY